jgi:rhodanese-related sulfurtransferase
VPDPKQEIAVEGPLLERLKLRALTLLVRLLRLPYRLLTLPLKELRAEVASLRAAAVESLAYVGVELRRLGDLVEQGGAKAAPTPEETALAVLEVHGPVLVVGRRGQKAADALASAGYDVTQVDGLEDLDAEGGHFGAVLYMREPSEANGADLQRIGDLLSQEGALLVARRTSPR